MKLFLSKTKEVEGEIEKFLENIERAALLFELALKDYFNERMERFEDKCKEIDQLEHDSDEVRRDIKRKLYSYSLLPDSRGDVLGLIENLDNVIDLTKKVVSHFSIETPIIYPFLKDDFIELAETSVKAVCELIGASRAFFCEFGRVNDYLVKVFFWEHEADKIEEQIKRKVFQSDQIEAFSRKVHIRYFSERISGLADEAESVGERLSVYAIKRAI